MRDRPALRLVAPLCAAIVGMHQLRSLAAAGGDHAHAHGTGASVIAALLPLLTLALAAGLARLLARAAAGPSAHGALGRVRRVAPLASAGLLLAYGNQELLHGLLSSDPAGTLHGAVAHGGWIVLPLALAAGVLLALALRTVRALERRGGGISVPRPLWPLATVRLVPQVAGRPPRIVDGRHLAGRGPPAAFARP